MKVLQLRTEKCVQCKECMSACSKAWFKEDSPALSRIKVENKATYPNINVCNQCGAPGLVKVEGCTNCLNCGYSKCG